MLKVTHLTKKHGSFIAVDNISFNVKEGEIFGLLGPNGAGKSTLIKMLTSFWKPTSGDATINGISIKNRAKIKGLIGWAPQEDSFYDKLTVYENLIYFGSLYNIKRKPLAKKAVELIELLKISDKKNALASSLSGGMKRRLNIAIALIHEPRVLFLDEPTVGVDPLSRMALWEVIENIKKQKITIVYCTHYLTEADRLCSRVAIIRRGRLVIISTPKKLKEKYGETLEDAFFNLLQGKDTND